MNNPKHQHLPAALDGGACSSGGRLRVFRPGLPALMALVTLVLLIAALTPAPALGLPADLFSLGASVQGENILVEAADEQTAARTLRLGEAGWRSLAARFDAEPPGRVHITVLEDPEYESVQPAPMTRGFATFGGNRIFLRGSQLDREVVVHELTHIFLGHAIRPGLDVPDWFNEGLAQYASGAETPTLTLIYEASAGNLLSLPRLGQVDALHGEDRQLATLQGLAVVQFLVAEFGEPRLWDLVDNLSIARSFEHALFITYGYSDVEIDQQWSAYADDAYSLLSPAALQVLSTALIGALALIAAAVWFLRRTVRLYGGDDPRLQASEVQAAHLAEDLLRMNDRHEGGAEPGPGGLPGPADHPPGPPPELPPGDEPRV